MQRLQAFKFELRPDGEQVRQMRQFAGACRFVFNQALRLQKNLYANGQKKLSYAGLCKQLTAWRNGASVPSGFLAPWLAESPVHPLQQSLKDLERAYANFFAGRAAFPCFKKKGMSDSFRYPDPKQIRLEQDNRRIFLPKLGWLRYRASRIVPGTIKNVTVSRTGDKWFVSIQTAREVDAPVHPSSSIIGLDVGIARFATFSDGRFMAPANSFQKHEARLRRYQRALSRKVKFSANWKKAKTKVQKIHTRIARVRQNFLHQSSTAICKNHAVVVIEDLQVKNMSRSAKGTEDAPGKRVRQKSGLNRAILDQGWSEFRRQLEYKLAWAGGQVIAVPPHHTSCTCPQCGHVAKENRPSQARFQCQACGYENHADVVGAINILHRGMKIIEGQDTVDASTGRETVARIACEVNGAATPSTAGTRRSVQEGLFSCAA